MLSLNKPFWISLAVNIVLAVLLLRGCGKASFGGLGAPCPEGVVTKRWSDTAHVKPGDVTPVITLSKPQPKRIVKYNNLQNAGSYQSTVSDSSRLTFAAVISSTPTINDCLDTVYYEDGQTVPDQYKYSITDTLAGNRIIGRKIAWYNLAPTITNYVEKKITAKDGFKVYAGAFGGYARGYTAGSKGSFTIGPTLLLTTAPGLAVSYGFDARNNGHLVNLYYKIKLK